MRRRRARTIVGPAMVRTAFPALFAAVLCLAACGDDGTSQTEGPGGSSTTAAPATGDTTGPLPTTGEPTTAGPDATSDDTTAGPDATTTTGGTTEADTDADTETGTTGPICEPGTANCVCDAGACQDELACVDDLCVSQQLCAEDVTEPDDVEGEAHDLGELTDDDDMKASADGYLSGVSDVDWYRYTGEDTFGHTAEPTILLTGGAGIRVCQFLDCVEGGPAQTEVNCPAGTKFAISGDLRPGCCGGNQFTLVDYDCPQTSDDLHVYVRLDMPDVDACVDYSLQVHF